MLREISLFLCLIHTFVLFFLLFESRYPAKKTRVISLVTMVPLTVINFTLVFRLDEDLMGMVMLATLSLPSLIVFWFMAKNRDGRFFFTFCFVDSTVLEIIYITQILNYYITPDSYIFMFVARLIAFPLIEWFTYKKIRSVFLDVQKHTMNGWGIFAAIAALFYVLLSLVVNYPSSITARPEYLPAAILLFILVPIIYLHFIATLQHQQQFFEISQQENILRMQTGNIIARIEELAEANEKFRVERHNFRHKLKVITSLLETEQYDECLALLAEYGEALEKTNVRRYCKSPVIDAVLSAYIQKAKGKEIELTFGFAFPDKIPVNESELATAIANALENAINACEKLEPDKRCIDIKVLRHPRFMIQITNSYEGEVVFDENGIPINCEEEHGFGTRFIAAFCDKNGGYYQFNADGEKFTLYLNF